MPNASTSTRVYYSARPYATGGQHIYATVHQLVPQREPENPLAAALAIVGAVVGLVVITLALGGGW